MLMLVRFFSLPLYLFHFAAIWFAAVTENHCTTNTHFRMGNLVNEFGLVTRIAIELISMNFMWQHSYRVIAFQMKLQLNDLPKSYFERIHEVRFVLCRKAQHALAFNAMSLKTVFKRDTHIRNVYVHVFRHIYLCEVIINCLLYTRNQFIGKLRLPR